MQFLVHHNVHLDLASDKTLRNNRFQVTIHIIDWIYAYFLCLRTSLSSELLLLLLLALNSKENLLHFTKQKAVLHSNSNNDQIYPQYKIFCAVHNI